MGAQNSQSNPEQKINAVGCTTLDFKLYYRAIATKNSMLLVKKKKKHTCRPMT
jgi:tmRNA-binding protein